MELLVLTDDDWRSECIVVNEHLIEMAVKAGLTNTKESIETQIIKGAFWLVTQGELKDIVYLKDEITGQSTELPWALVQNDLVVATNIASQKIGKSLER